MEILYCSSVRKLERSLIINDRVLACFYVLTSFGLVLISNSLCCICIDSMCSHGKCLVRDTKSIDIYTFMNISADFQCSTINHKVFMDDCLCALFSFFGISNHVAFFIVHHALNALDRRMKVMAKKKRKAKTHTYEMQKATRAMQSHIERCINGQVMRTLSNHWTTN